MIWGELGIGLVGRAVAQIDIILLADDHLAMEKLALILGQMALLWTVDRKLYKIIFDNNSNHHHHHHHHHDDWHHQVMAPHIKANRLSTSNTCSQTSRGLQDELDCSQRLAIVGALAKQHWVSGAGFMAAHEN